MRIVQRDPTLYAPVVTTNPAFVVVSGGVVTTESHRAVEFPVTTGASGYYNYAVDGLNLEGLTVDSELVDISDFPVVKRGAGVNQQVSVRFSNSRGTTSPFSLNFSNVSPPPVQGLVSGFVEGSYLEYSWNRVFEIFDQLPDPNLFATTAPYDRHRGSVIPHASFTGHVFNGRVTSATGHLSGRKFTAITPRHVVGVAHYGNGLHRPGDTIHFKTVDNTIVAATIAYVFDGKFSDLPPTTLNGDICLYVLTEDLPASITPVPIMGDWFGDVAIDGSTFTSCYQAFGIALFGNDGHLAPVQAVNYSDFTTDISTLPNSGSFDFEGETFSYFDTSRNARASSVTYDPDWAYNLQDSIFHHHLRGGDSGAPVLFPYTSGWALGGIISGNVFSADAFNRLIVVVNDLAGVVGSYTVTVAADPTA